jgi:tRNA C32,U32 (ribose-2'-O)-methylase TrmJ
MKSSAARLLPKPHPMPSAAAHLERITELLETILDRSGYVHARVEGSTRMKIRRLVRRLQLNAHDSEVWLGMLRQILWKLENISDSNPD